MRCAASAGANGTSSDHGSQKRRKYHEESTKVSMVSVSRSAGPPHFGHVTKRNVGWRLSGDSPVGRDSASSGGRTGNWSSGPPTMPSSGQNTTGMGQPQYRWRDTNQSRSR